MYVGPRIDARPGGVDGQVGRPEARIVPLDAVDRRSAAIEFRAAVVVVAALVVDQRVHGKVVQYEKVLATTISRVGSARPM